MQWRHRSVHIALSDINKKGVEICERQNRCHDDWYFILNACNESVKSKKSSKDLLTAI